MKQRSNNPTEGAPLTFETDPWLPFRTISHTIHARAQDTRTVITRIETERHARDAEDHIATQRKHPRKRTISQRDFCRTIVCKLFAVFSLSLSLWELVRTTLLALSVGSLFLFLFLRCRASFSYIFPFIVTLLLLSCFKRNDRTRPGL